MAVALDGAVVDIDVARAGLDEEALGVAMSEAMAVKGYCVIDPTIEDGRLEGVRADISALEAAFRFKEPPVQLLEGLLGLAGSARIAELDAPDSEYGLDLENLTYFDSAMTDLGMTLAPYLPNLNVEIATRTYGMLHEAGTVMTDGPPLTPDMCSRWITILANHRLMCVWCLGPEAGTLELQPFDDESNENLVTMAPGTFVILRPDALSHRFSSSGKSYCLTSFFQKDGRLQKHRIDDDDDASPCCKALEDWAFEKILEFKESDPEVQARMALPRHWELHANHSSFVGQHIAVRTCSVREPASWDETAWTCAFLCGPDYAEEVPMARFSINDHYDPDPESWRQFKICVKHGSFIDGQELFDNALFRISKNEASGMDPGHRLTMETGYQALVRDGYKVSSLMNSRGGVYVANPPPNEWNFAEKVGVGGGVCGGGGSIACGRVSFTHGMKGPCISVDVEGASSLMTVNMCSTNLSRTGKFEPVPFGLCSSWSLCLTPVLVVHQCAGGMLCPKGRAFTFDASGNGTIRGECAVSMVLKSLTDIVDSELVVKEDGEFIGALASCSVNQSGRRASMTSKDNVALQQVMAEAIQLAEVSPLDVDAVETFCDAQILNDALEVAATSRAYRPEGLDGLDVTPPLAIQSIKCSVGTQVEAMGFTQILKVLLASHWGGIHPMLHFRIINPHIDLEICERSAQIGSEALEFRLSSSYTGITNTSRAGTNCHCLTFGQVEDVHCHPLPEAKFVRDKILYWPKGGGSLDESAVPRSGYSILGTFTRWQPQKMESDGRGTWSFTFTLGDNRWERFQVLLDGDRRQALYPNVETNLGKATKTAAVEGPKDVLSKDSWIIDARAVDETMYFAQAGYSIQDAFLSAASADKGEIGDRFRVSLRVSGKWRTVDWANLGPSEDVQDPFSVSEAVATYSVSGSWNGNALQAMSRDSNVPGLHYVEVMLPRSGISEFQIVRNNDWTQYLCPETHLAGTDSTVLGPDQNIGHCWALRGAGGDVFRIEFQRACEPGSDSKRVTWSAVRRENLTQEMVVLASRPQFCVQGDWAQGVMQKMSWTGEYYQFFFELGKTAAEGAFQIFQDGSYGRCIYPSEPNASPHTKHLLRGPDNMRESKYWLIGTEPDEPSPGKRYEIRLRVNEDGLAERLDWVLVRGVDGLEEAWARGFLAVGE